MFGAFQYVLNSQSKAIIIGSDCPDISSQIIEEAFIRLDKHDCVIGPSEDGGYYLLGMKKLHSALFEDIEWSSSKVMEQTIRKIESLQLSYTQLPKLNDIDTIDDLRQFPDLYQSISAD